MKWSKQWTDSKRQCTLARYIWPIKLVRSLDTITPCTGSFSLSLSVPTVTSLLDVPFFRVEQAFEKMYIFAKEMIKKIEGMLVNLANAKWLCYIACTFGATFA